jgi:hypothetical protein
MPQQTAIEYLRTKLLEDSHLTVFDIFNKAREIEKQQIQDAFLQGLKTAKDLELEKFYNTYLKNKQ